MGCCYKALGIGTDDLKQKWYAIKKIVYEYNHSFTFCIKYFFMIG